MATPSPRELTDLVFAILRDQILSPAADFTPQSNLVASGLDSLAVTQLLLCIEERTGVWVDEGLLTPETLASAMRSLVLGAHKREEGLLLILDVDQAAAA